MQRPPRPLDTAREAYFVQLEAYRRMSRPERLAIAFQLSEELHSFFLAGICLRHPGYTSQEIQLAALRALLGPDLFREVFPEAQELPA